MTQQDGYTSISYHSWPEAKTTINAEQIKGLTADHPWLIRNTEIKVDSDGNMIIFGTESQISAIVDLR